MNRELKELELHLVEPDPDNPRILESLKSLHIDASRENILMHLRTAPGGDGPGISELEKSIIATRGILDPIIVKPLGDKYLCIEGNTRLAIYEKNFEREPNVDFWKKIPAVIYTDIDDPMLEMIRLGAHFVGKKEWSLYAKGAYISNMIQNEAKTFEDIVEIIGGTPSKLASLLESYNDFVKYYEPLFSGTNEAGGGVANEKDMSKFVNANTGSVRSALETFVGDPNDDDAHKKKFAEWVKLGKIESAADDVRKIPIVLKNDEAREAFISDDRLKIKDVLRLIPRDPDNSSLKLSDADISQLADELKIKVNETTLDQLRNLDEEKLNSLLMLNLDLNQFLDHLNTD
tara:strand:+ start:507 stop:1544 length:1038 start_codon:yes stop_codon:yes gene_type:complete